MSLFFRIGAAAALACCIAEVPAHAQDEDAQLWTSITAAFDLGSDTTFSSQVVSRFSDKAEGLAELQLQADVEKKLSERLSLGAGYSFVPRYERGRLTTREHRIRQQVSTALGEVLGGEVEARVRLEQRWRDDGDDVMFRLRPRLMWTRVIGPDDLELRLWHESFVQLNDSDWGGEARYSRMRNQVSLQRSLGEAITGEFGYLNQYSLSKDEADELVHALTFALNFDF